jgi:hypothetical protein
VQLPLPQHLHQLQHRPLQQRHLLLLHPRHLLLLLRHRLPWEHRLLRPPLPSASAATIGTAFTAFNLDVAMNSEVPCPTFIHSQKPQALPQAQADEAFGIQICFKLL